MTHNESLTQSIAILKIACPSFNVIEHNAEQFWRLIDKEGIHVDFWPLRKGINGFYGIDRRPRDRRRRPVKFIVIDAKLTVGEDWLIHGLHELVHHYLDAPASSQEVYWSRQHKRKSKEEVRADKLALIFRYPKRLVLELMNTPFEQLVGYDVEELKKRVRILEEIGE